MKLILAAAAVALLIHGINIFLNFTGIDLGPLTFFLDTAVNLGNWLVGAAILFVVIIYLKNNFLQK